MNRYTKKTTKKRIHKGFTLIEILTVIILLSLLVVIAIPAYNAVLERTKEKNYQAKKDLIEIAAEKYAVDENLMNSITVSVNELIESGYITPDKVDKDGKYKIINGVTGESMACYTVTIEFEQGLPNAKVNETTDCKLVNQENGSDLIQIKAYKMTIDNYVELEYLNQDKAFEWSNENVLLVVTLKNPETKTQEEFIKLFGDMTNNGIKFKWIGKGVTIKEGTTLVNDYREINIDNIDNYKNAYIVSAASFQNQEYQVELTEPSGLLINNRAVIRIDKEAPTANAAVKTDWENGGADCNASSPENCTKKITIQTSDQNGSGAINTCISTDKNSFNLSNCKSHYNDEQEYMGDNISFNRTAGTYYIYTQDIAGNTSSEPVDSILVANIDIQSPIINSLDHSTAGWTKYDMEISGIVQDKDSGIKAYIFSQSEDQPDSGWTELKIITDKEIEVKKVITANKANEGSKSWYLYTKDAVGRVKKSSSSITTKIDITAPKITYSNPTVVTYHTDSIGYDIFPTVDATCVDEGSGVKEFILSNSNGETKTAVNGQGRMDLKTLGNNQSITMNCSDNAGNSPTIKSQSFIVRELSATFETNGVGAISYSQDTCITYDPLGDKSPYGCSVAVPTISGSGNLGWGLVANEKAVIRRQDVDGKAVYLKTDDRIFYAIKDWTIIIGNDFTNRYPQIFYDDEYNIYADKDLQYIKDYLESTPVMLYQMKLYLMYSPSGGEYYYTDADKQIIYNYIDSIK